MEVDLFESWEDADTAENFFSGDEDPAIKKEQEEEDADKKDTKKEEDKSEDLFSQSDDFEDSEDSEKEKENEVQDGKSNINFYNALKSRGVITEELEEGEDLTDDLAEELIEDGLNSYIDNQIKDKLNSLPEDIQGLIKYSLSGGDLNSYLNRVDVGSLPTDLDLEKEENQIFAIERILAEEGNDADTIETQIEFLKDSGKLKDFSTNKYKLWSAKKEKDKNDLLKDQEEKSNRIKRELKERKQEYSTYLQENTQVKGISVPKTLKRELPNYLEDRTVKLQNGSFISEMQRDLFYELPKNREALMQLAIMMKNRKEDGTFDFSFIAKNIETEVVGNIKNELRRNRSNLPSSADKTVKQGKSLASYFQK